MQKQKSKIQYIWFPMTVLMITFTLQSLVVATQAATGVLEDEEGVYGEIDPSVSVDSDAPPSSVDPCDLETVVCEHETNYIKIKAYVTGYNSYIAQTDSSPCIAAGGYICGRSDVITCSRDYPLGTTIEVDGKDYICLDRTAPKYDHRFDIFCDKDDDCPARVTGWKEVIIKVKQ